MVEMVTNPYTFGDMNAGTASDHFKMGVSHLQRSIQLLFTRGSGADDVTYVPAEKPDLAAIAIAGVPADDDESVPRRGNCIIFPTDNWKEGWDLWVLLFILYSAVMVPYRICFESPATGAMFIFEQTCTVSFIIDVFLNFNTAYMQDDRWIVSRATISMHYLRGWAWIDIPSSLPIELIDAMLEGDNTGLGYLRFLRLFRLLRLLRLLKLGEYIASLEIRFDLNLTFLRIVQMLLALLFLAHILGCFWFYMAALVGIDPEIVTWVSTYDGGSGIDAGAEVQYLYAVYWALTTLTTVGYGDITPTNNVERIYSLFALLTGALVFGYMLSSIGSLVQAIDRQAALNEEKMDEVKEYMRWRKLPRDLVSRLRRYYNYYYSRKTAFDESAILGDLTPALRFEVVSHTLKDTIGRIPLFAKYLDPLFQMEVFPLFKPINASPKEIIYQKGDLSLALFFLVKGQIEVISGVDGRVLYRIRNGSHFGESVLTGRRRSATHRAASSCEMFAISSEDLSELFEKRPHEGRIILDSVMREHKRKEQLRTLSLRLLINHLGKSSPHDSAALRLQLAWGRKCDEAAYKATGTESLNADGEPDIEGTSGERSQAGSPITIKPGGGAPTSPGSSVKIPQPATRSNTMRLRSSGERTPPGTSAASPVDMAALMLKLGKIDELMTKLDRLVGGTQSQPSSNRGMGRRGPGNLTPK